MPALPWRRRLPCVSFAVSPASIYLHTLQTSHYLRTQHITLYTLAGSPPLPCLRVLWRRPLRFSSAIIRSTYEHPFPDLQTPRSFHVTAVSLPVPLSATDFSCLHILRQRSFLPPHNVQGLSCMWHVLKLKRMCKDTHSITLTHKCLHKPAIYCQCISFAPRTVVEDSSFVQRSASIHRNSAARTV